MSSVSSIARSGMVAAISRVDAAAGNIANQQNPAYRRQQAAQSTTPGGGVASTPRRSDTAGDDGSLADDIVAQKAASYDFKANLQVLKAADRMLGTLLDTHA